MLCLRQSFNRDLAGVYCGALKEMSELCDGLTLMNSSIFNCPAKSDKIKCILFNFMDKPKSSGSDLNVCAEVYACAGESDQQEREEIAGFGTS